MKPPALLRPALSFLRRTQALERYAIVRNDVSAHINDAHAAPSEFAHHLVALREDGPHLIRRRVRRTLLSCRRHGARRMLSLAHAWTWRRLVERIYGHEALGARL